MNANINKSSHVIPEGGTLGILANGYRGVMLWRQERLKIVEKKLKNKLNKNPNNEKS